jgi:hypothetical protein
LTAISVTVDDNHLKTLPFQRPNILDQNNKPRSASGLLLIQSQQNKSSQSDLYSSASQSNLNPISTLYELSKNYKSI